MDCYDVRMTAPRIEISKRMRALMAYPKMAGPVPRLFVLESNYWLDAACMRAAQRLGWEIERAPVLLEGKMPREMVGDLVRRLITFRPDFVFSVNLSGMDESGLFAGLFADLGIPHVTWFVDDPRTILMGRSCYGSHFAIALTWEAAYQGYLGASGFAGVYVMPLAADVPIFNAPPTEDAPLPPSFVGNSMTDFATREWAWIEKHPHLAAMLQEAFDAGRVTRQRFGQGIETIFDPADLARLDPDEHRHAEMLCFIEGTRRLRYDTVQALAPEGLVACGDEAWQQCTPHCGPYVNYTQELPRHYRVCSVNLNITSIQMATTVNQRVFDCPAAGGFLLTDAQAALEDLFDVEHEVACYHTVEECRELLRFYREHPAARRTLTEKARKRVLGEHTYTHRLEQIAALVKEHFGD